MLLEQQKFMESIRAYETATAVEPRNHGAWAGLAGALARASYTDRSAQAYAKAVELNPDAPGVQMGYAHVLKTLGDQAGALAAYRAAVKAKPDFGEVYWSMANLKTFRFEDSEVAAMEEQAASGIADADVDQAFHHALYEPLENRVVAQLLGAFFDIQAAAFTPKPERRAYEIFLERYAIEPREAAMFEDLARNLEVPHALGMRTVLVVGPAPGRLDWLPRRLTQFFTDGV